MLQLGPDSVGHFSSSPTRAQCTWVPLQRYGLNALSLQHDMIMMSIWRRARFAPRDSCLYIHNAGKYARERMGVTRNLEQP